MFRLPRPLGKVFRRLDRYLRHDTTYHRDGDRVFWIAFDAAYYLLYSMTRRVLGRRGAHLMNHALGLEHALERVTLPNSDRLLLRRVHRAVVREVFDEEIYGRLGLGAGDEVIDAGAHWGVFTLWAARRVGPRGHVIAIEPDPLNFAQLKRNVERNRLTNVTLLHAGLWDRPGEGAMTVGQGPRAAQMERIDPAGQGVPLLTLDEILERRPLERLSLVKVDVEGAELRVLRGGPRTISRGPSFAMEVHPDACDADAVEALLRQAGYSMESTRAEEGEGHLYLLWARRGR